MLVLWRDFQGVSTAHSPWWEFPHQGYVQAPNPRQVADWAGNETGFFRIAGKDVADMRPVVDLIWFHEDYLDLFAASGLELVAHYTPLGREDEPCAWLSETSIAPLRRERRFYNQMADPKQLAPPERA
jgi:hypothetical protein